MLLDTYLSVFLSICCSSQSAVSGRYSRTSLGNSLKKKKNKKKTCSHSQPDHLFAILPTSIIFQVHTKEYSELTFVECTELQGCMLIPLAHSYWKLYELYVT